MSLDDVKASPLHTHKKTLISWLFSALRNSDLPLRGDVVVAMATMLDVPGCLCQDEVCTPTEPCFRMKLSGLVFAVGWLGGVVWYSSLGNGLH